MQARQLRRSTRENDPSRQGTASSRSLGQPSVHQFEDFLDPCTQDLFNIGARQSSKDWHLGHLYQPRAYVPGSIMPSYPYLFETKATAEPGDEVVKLPPGQEPAGQVVVARPEALDLVKYLQGLNHTYPVLPPAVQVAPATAAPSATPTTAAAPAS